MIRLWNFCSKNFSNVSRVTRREVRSSREFEIHKRDLETSVPSIIEVFKTSSDERTSLSRIFHSRKGRSLVLKTGATLFPCKGRRGSNEGTERLGILHEEENVDPRITIMSLFVSTTGWSFTLLEEKPRLRRKVVFFLPFLFFFPFLFFSFLPSFFLSLSTFARERRFRVPSRSKRSFYYVPSIIPIISAYFFFFPSTNVEEKSSSKENCCSKLSA